MEIKIELSNYDMDEIYPVFKIYRKKNIIFNFTRILSILLYMLCVSIQYINMINGSFSFNSTSFILFILLTILMMPIIYVDKMWLKTAKRRMDKRVPISKSIIIFTDESIIKQNTDNSKIHLSISDVETYYLEKGFVLFFRYDLKKKFINLTPYIFTYVPFNSLSTNEKKELELLLQKTVKSY